MPVNCLSIDTIGNVGIGIKNPACKLEVNGILRVTSENDNGTIFFKSKYRRISSEPVDTTRRRDFNFYNSIGANPGGCINFLSSDKPEIKWLTIRNDGNVGIATTDPKSKLQVVGLPEYADNAAAIAAGLTPGAFYRTGDYLKVVH